MNKEISRLWVIIILFSVIHISCEKQKSGWKGQIIKERSGVIIVKNPNYPVYGKDILTLREELSLGKKVGEKEFMFIRVRSIDVDEGGNIYVLDNGASEIRVFNKNGKFLRAFGGQGQGPGEMQLPMFIQILNNKELIVYDPPTKRFLFFSLDGKYLRKIFTRLGYPLRPIKWTKKGNLVTLIIPPPIKNRRKLLKADRNLKDSITIAQTEEDDSFLKHKIKVFGPSIKCAAFKDDSLVWGNPRKYELYILNPEGKLVRKIIRKCKPVKITKKERKRIEKRFSDLAKRGYKLIIPKHYPFFRGIWVDEERRIFVLIYERVSEKRRFYYMDIFDSVGRYIGKIPFRIRFDTLLFKRKKLYTIERDREGFYKVKRYNILWKY
jgi:hypothetical protein